MIPSLSWTNRQPAQKQRRASEPLLLSWYALLIIRQDGVSWESAPSARPSLLCFHSTIPGCGGLKIVESIDDLCDKKQH